MPERPSQFGSPDDQPEPMEGTPPAIKPDRPTAEQLGVTHEVPFADTWDGRHIVLGPDDHLVINLGKDASAEQIDRMIDQLEEHWPEIAGAFIVIAVETVTVIEA